MKPKQLAEIKAQCEAATGLCENCSRDGFCAGCLNAPPFLSGCYGCIKEIERLENKLRWIKAEICSDNSEGNKLNRIRKVFS